MSQVVGIEGFVTSSSKPVKLPGGAPEYRRYVTLRVTQADSRRVLHEYVLPAAEFLSLFTSVIESSGKYGGTPALERQPNEPLELVEFEPPEITNAVSIAYESSITSIIDEVEELSALFSEGATRKRLGEQIKSVERAVNGSVSSVGRSYSDLKEYVDDEIARLQEAVKVLGL